MAQAFLATLEDDARPVYEEVIAYLAALGYHPQKEKTNLSFKHALHNKQMAKMGIRTGKAPAPFFALRFSACKGYSKRFEDIVSTLIEKYPARAARCPSGCCDYCKGEAEKHIYRHEGQASCGAYALEIPGITVNDLAEIKQLISQEHVYLMEYEVGAAAQ